MLCFFNFYVTVIVYVYSFFINMFSYYYMFSLYFVFLLFLCYRFPYCYSPYFFFTFLVVIVFNMFLCLMFRRIEFGVNEFFSSFIPVGTPIYICPLVCLAETVSYVIRPIVLILRPFINISLGGFGGVAICNLCFVSLYWLLLVFVLFFYEVFVAVVHWYIVTSILSFSVDH
uniref:ATP synthase subunit 6 n=1 Tax=Dipylidium caninum TaxID=66787 RepID=N0DP91_DIPCN|nr:ATP synthase F0 subunit 6 [Dipylidium caninum]BAN15718.1 ATP synthase subunit 6 [Dipylidium caninum]